ncbi:MAG: hypothetical protein ACK4N4_12005 [Burkholderiales bacterium]
MFYHHAGKYPAVAPTLPSPRRRLICINLPRPAPHYSDGNAGLPARVGFALFRIFRAPSIVAFEKAQGK